MACTSVYIDKLRGCSVNPNWNFVPIDIIVLCVRMVNGALKPQTKLSRITSQMIDWLVQIIYCTFTTCKGIDTRITGGITTSSYIHSVCLLWHNNSYTVSNNSKESSYYSFKERTYMRHCAPSLGSGAHQTTKRGTNSTWRQSRRLQLMDIVQTIPSNSSTDSFFYAVKLGN